MAKKYIVILGGILVKETRELRVDEKARCDATVAMANADPNSRIIFGVGVHVPQFPDLCEKTVKYLMKRDIPRERILWCPKGWNTVNELETDLEELISHDVSEVIVITSWYHMPRVRFIWWRLSGPKATFRATWPTDNWLWSLAWEAGGWCRLSMRFRQLKTRWAVAVRCRSQRSAQTRRSERDGGISFIFFTRSSSAA